MPTSLAGLTMDLNDSSQGNLSSRLYISLEFVDGWMVETRTIIIMHNKLIFNVFCLLLSAFSAMAQAKKPTLMVVPSDIYCTRKGFIMEVDDQGQKLEQPDYKRAFQNDDELRAIIAQVNNFMIDQGFPLKDMEQEIKSMENEDQEEKELTDKAGNELKESRLDRVKRRAKADIILDLDFAIKRNGPEKIMTLNLKGLDAYTNKNIAGTEGAGRPSANVAIDILLREDMYAKMTDFNSRLQMYFDNIFKEGREVTITIRLAEDAPVDFEKEYDGKELSEIIDDWFQANSVSGRYTVGDMSDVRMPVTVRIPLFTQDNKAIDARQFAQQLRKFLRTAPYNLTAKITSRGLGQAHVIIGSAKGD